MSKYDHGTAAKLQLRFDKKPQLWLSFLVHFFHFKFSTVPLFVHIVCITILSLMVVVIIGLTIYLILPRQQMPADAARREANTEMYDDENAGRATNMHDDFDDFIKCHEFFEIFLLI